MKKVPITPEGYRRLQEELKRIKAVDRPQVVAEIEEARSHGDLTENAEYDAAKERQLQITRRIAELEDKLSRAQVIDPSKLDHQKVVFGASVRLSDADSGEEHRYQIVGADESDISRGRISVESPLGRSLIGKEPNDVVTVVTPRGTREFEILEIKYQ